MSIFTAHSDSLAYRVMNGYDNKYQGAGDAVSDRHMHTGTATRVLNTGGLGWYDNHARWYDPVSMRFTTPDPLAEKYFHISPFTNCANNPVMITDPTGCDLFLRGSSDNLHKLLSQLNSIGNDGVIFNYDTNLNSVSYFVNNEESISENAKQLMSIIDDRKIQVNILAIDNYKRNKITIIGGAFMGTTIRDDIVSTCNIVNPSVLEKIDYFTTLGTTLMHEITESYFAGRLSQVTNCCAYPAFSNNTDIVPDYLSSIISKFCSVYNIAHNAATPQVPIYYDEYYKDGLPAGQDIYIIGPKGDKKTIIDWDYSKYGRIK